MSYLVSELFLIQFQYVLDYKKKKSRKRFLTDNKLPINTKKSDFKSLK